MADEVAAITGLGAAEAANFLEMAGGNVETAIALFFDMQGGSGGGAMSDAPLPSGPARSSPAHILLFGHEAAPPSWLEQGFEFCTEPNSRTGIIQHKNGPCGVLAVVNAEVIATLGCPLPSTPVDDTALCAALGNILWRCANDGRITLARWAQGEVGGEVEAEEMFVAADAAAVSAKLLPSAAAFRGRGGCCLFCYAVVLTRGCDAVKADARHDGGSVPLVSGPHALCGTELINLLLAGLARSNVGAYEGGGSGGKVAWRAPRAVGLLSREELESGVPLADALKSPTTPVWVLHGGDHFTVAWQPEPSPQRRFEARVKALFGPLIASGLDANAAAAKALETAAAEAQAAVAPPPLAPTTELAADLALWNGLPPARQLCWLRLRGCGGELRTPAPPAPDMHRPTHWRLTEGEVESIVQAAADDKRRRPGCWREHAYEINLVTAALASEDEASAARPPSEPPPIRLEVGAPPAPGAAWRCASCYNGRFKTMCFGENAAGGGALCKFCGRPAAEAGWTIWRQYAALPAPVQRRIDRMSGPKVLAVLRTRWPEAEVAVLGADGTEVRPGCAGFEPSKVDMPAV